MKTINFYTDTLSEIRFADLLNKFPDDIRQRLADLSDVAQRLDYHPEGDVAKHIKIVTGRCFKTHDINLILTGLFHDLGKLETSEADEKGVIHSLGHEDYGADLVWYYRDLIQDLGADWRLVRELVAEHMAVKYYPKMNKSSQRRFHQMACFDKLMVFARADDMLLPESEFEAFLAGKDVPQRTH